MGSKSIIVILIIILLSALLCSTRYSYALPHSEVQRLMRISSKFKEAEEEILAVWASLSKEIKRRLRESQVAWVKKHRDMEALELMNRGYSYVQAYTIVTKRKANELKRYLYLASTMHSRRKNTTTTLDKLSNHSITDIFIKTKAIDRIKAE